MKMHWSKHNNEKPIMELRIAANSRFCYINGGKQKKTCLTALMNLTIIDTVLVQIKLTFLVKENNSFIIIEIV